MKCSQIDKIIKTLYSNKTIDQCISWHEWIKNLSNSKIISDSEHYMLICLNLKFIEKMKNEFANDNNGNYDGREYTHLFEKTIFNFFTDKNIGGENACYADYHFANVYDLPLNINLIEYNLSKKTVKIYLQRPGLLIGKGGRTIDGLKKAISELTDSTFEILIVETKGRREPLNEWDLVF